MHVVSKSLVSMISIISLIALGATSAQASDDPTKDLLNALKSVTNKSTSLDTAVLKGLSDAIPSKSGLVAIESLFGGKVVKVSSDPSQPISFGTNFGDLSIKLPFAGRAGKAIPISNGLVAFDNQNFTTSAPILKGDGSLQLTTLIRNSQAPQNFSYQFDLGANFTVQPLGSGLALMKSGKFVAAVAAPWAKDAQGRDVPTHYEVDGSTITQVVEHQKSDFTYPIVADPWLGTNLFSSIYLASWTYAAQPVVNLNLSPWGWLVYTGIAQGGLPLSFGAGQAILDTAGWDEAWSKGGSIRAALDKPSQRQQFSCHALGAIAAGEWNLEKGRPNRLNGNWGAGVAMHHCNWKYAEGSQTD